MKSWSVFAEGRGSGRREGLTWAMRKHLGMVIGSLSWLRWYFLKCIHMSKFIWFYVKFQFSSVGQSCLTLCDHMDLSTPGFPVHYQLPELAQIHVHQVSDAIQSSHPCYSLLLLPSIFPSIRVFSNESVLCIMWPKDWNFSFSISPCNEYSGLISFRIDWFDLLAVQGTLKSLLQHHS